MDKSFHAENTFVLVDEGDYVDGPVYSSDGIFYSVVNDNGIRVEIHESNVIELDKVRQMSAHTIKGVRKK